MVALAKRVRVEGAARSRVAADYKAKYANGWTVRRIAAETGRSYGFVHRVLGEAGVQLRPRGGSNPGGRRRAR